jgi:X-Pro dipeptidyl-peptidase
MRTRLIALAAAATLVVPLVGSSGAHSGHVLDTSNGTKSGPVRSTAKMPGTASTKKLPDMDKVDPVRYRLKDAVVEHVQVRSRNGIDDIWVDIIRPRTKPGVKVPTIMNASPYYNTLGRGWQGHCKSPHQAGIGDPGCGDKHTPFPEHYDDYFVPRGYAVALMDLRGTRNTSGCQVYGDRDEVFDAVDVVDWIADQKWSNGKVGLTGGSYDGTVANGAAVEQPISGRHKNAVAAIIPIRAIDRWYDYHFLNGVPSTGHALTPAGFTAQYAAQDIQNSGTTDPLTPVRIAQRKACIPTLGVAADAGYAPTYQDSTNAHWSERDFVKDAKGTKAAVFIIHGLYDFNVKTNNAGHLWTALPKSAPKKMWLLNGDHVDPDSPDPETAQKGGHVLPFTFQKAYRTAVHRWWAQFLKGVPAGALDTPAVEVQTANGSWQGSRSWPVAGPDQVLSLGSGGKLTSGPSGEGEITYKDGAGSGAASAVFVGAPAKKATRISGQITFDLAYTLTGTDTNLTVRVDDLPPGADADAPVGDKVLDGDVEEGAFTVTFGFARAAYREEIEPQGLSRPTLPSPVVPGTVTRTTFPSLPMDYVLKKGHRLRFTFGPALGGTLATNTGGDVSIQLAGQSTVRLPVAS